MMKFICKVSAEDTLSLISLHKVLTSLLAKPADLVPVYPLAFGAVLECNISGPGLTVSQSKVEFV